MKFLRTDDNEKFEILSNRFKLVEFSGGTEILRISPDHVIFHCKSYMSVTNQERGTYVIGSKCLCTRSSSASLALRNL